MIVDTQRLFTALLRRLAVTHVGDVGSLNGAEALSFARAVPQARIYAFEPNPRNFALMQQDAALTSAHIELVRAAASDIDGCAQFFLVAADYGAADPRRGMSSLHRRHGEWGAHAAVAVSTRRLDSFFAERAPGARRLALWLDTEGMAYQVIAGLRGVAADVQLLHVEVESAPCIGTQQQLYPAVRQLLRQLGFCELATDLPRRQVQFNALFVRRQLTPAAWLGVRTALLRAWLQHVQRRLAHRARTLRHAAPHSQS